jgi:SAM-dependent methyltransferase
VIGIVLTAMVVIGLTLSGLRLRARLAGFPVLRPAEEHADGGRHLMIVSNDVRPGEEVRRDAVAFALQEEIGVLDLVPADLPATAARDLLRRVDPAEYRADRLGIGRSVGAAVLAGADVLQRAELPEPGPCEPADLIGVVRRLKPYAGSGQARSGAEIAIAPGLRAGPDDLAKRRARLNANNIIVPLHLTLDIISFLFVAGALVADWRWGLIALAAYCLQPYLIFAGTAVHPRGLHIAALLRPLHDPYVWVRTALGRWRSAAEVADITAREQARVCYERELADGVDRFFEPRRADCPWCGSDDLSVRLRVPDLVYGKPGNFTLEECAGCGHVFQNPRLTPAGLDFYYRDFYDGVGASNAESIFLSAKDAYRARARMVEPFGTPKAWLDVGAGHAHFCATAREVWPDTVFDGLDWGDEIEEAARRGWIGRAHRGMFPDLTDELDGVYDVVSMHHYLEHTRDPFAELDAAAKILPPGGHLLIELPDPEWPLARMFGKYWMPWFQPQHQHMMPIENLKRALAERGLTPIAQERSAVHQHNDFVAAAYLFFAGLAPDPNRPWATRRPSLVRKVGRGLVWTVGVPALPAGLLLDRTVGHVVANRRGRGNAYRVLAKKPETR